MESADRHQRLFELFERAEELETEERERFLDEHCADDPELRRELEALLRAEEREVTFLDAPQPSALWAASRPESSLIGRRIGAYLIEEKIAAGGMGIVYKARQERPKRWVALKVSRQGLRERSLKRFEFEAEVLGRLKHPGIAEIHEAGTFEDAIGTVPYFVMEYIEDARPITRYCDERGLGRRSRLELFIQACEAVHAGHLKSVIHRDLKPENLLVDAQGRVKVIDFGVACVTDRDLRLTTYETGMQAVIGTLPYMSPEQVGGDPNAIDFRSDVYALGVLLHQILVGKVPLDLETASIPDAVRRIVEEDPKRIGIHDPSLRGDLETIVAKALEKDKERRYGLAADLANDVRHFLNDEPIQARPATTWYQFRKFTKRNRGLVFGFAVGTLALLLGFVLAISQAIRATEARDEARAERSQSLHQLYRASIVAAASAIETHDIGLARTSLAAAPVELRRWEWHHLWCRLDQSVLTVPIAQEHVTIRPVFLEGPEGESLIALEDHEARVVIDSRSGQITNAAARANRLIVPPGCEALWNEAHALEIVARDGARVVMTSEDVWHTFHGDPATWRLSDDLAWIVQVTPSMVRAWSTGNGGERSFGVPSSPTGLQRSSIAASGEVAFSASAAGPMIWDPRTESVRVLRDVPAYARTVAFHPRERRIALGLQDTTVRVWDVETLLPLPNVAQGHRHAVTDVAWTPDGERIVSVSLDRSLRVWDARTLDPRGVLHGHESGIWSVSTSRDGTRIATTAEDRTLRAWSTRHVRPGVLGTHDGIVYPTAFRDDGAWVASAGWDERIRVTDVESLEEIATFSCPPRTPIPTALAFDPGGQKLIALSDRLYGFDLTSGAPLPTTDETIAPSAGFMPIKYVGFLADGDRVPLPWSLTGEDVRLWNTRTGNVETCKRTELQGQLPSLCSPNGRFLVIPAEVPDLPVDVRRARGDVVGPITFYDFREGRNVRPGWVSRAFAFGLGPARVALRREDGDGRSIEIWDLDAGRLRGRLIGHSDAVYDVAWSRDGTRVFTAGRDSLRIWDPQRFEEIVPLLGHRSFVWSLAASRRGALVSGSGDGTVRIWNDRDQRSHLEAAARRARLRQVWEDALARSIDPRVDPIDEPLFQAFRLQRAMTTR